MVQQAMLPYNLSYADYSAVYNALSFVMASVHHSSSCRRARCQLAAASASCRRSGVWQQAGGRRKEKAAGDGSHRVSPLVEVFARRPALTPERDFESLERAVRGL